MRIFFKGIVLLTGLFFMFQTATSQQLKPCEWHKLEKLGILTETTRPLPPQSIASLQRILKRNRQRIADKSMGIVFAVFSGAMLSFGSFMLLTDSGQQGSESDVMIKSIGVITVTGGVLSAGIAIPLLLKAKKRKKQRDRLIRKYQSDSYVF